MMGKVSTIRAGVEVPIVSLPRSSVESLIADIGDTMMLLESLHGRATMLGRLKVHLAAFSDLLAPKDD